MASVRPRSRSAAASPNAAPVAVPAGVDPVALTLTAAAVVPSTEVALTLYDTGGAGVTPQEPGVPQEMSVTSVTLPETSSTPARPEVSDSESAPAQSSATATATPVATLAEAPVATLAAASRVPTPGDITETSTPTYSYTQPPPAVRRVLEFSLSGYMYDIAVVVHTLYQKKFVCARIKNPLWYVFQGLRWITTEMGPYQDISTDTVAYYEAMAAAESALIEETQQRLLAAPPEQQRSVSNELDNRATRLSRITSIIGKLKTVSFKKKLCEECVYLFYDPDFMKGLDTCRRLVCFKNGIWERGMTTVRQGQPEDSISLMINEDYSPGVEDTALVTDFYTYREKVLTKRKTGQTLLYVG